MSKRLHAWKDVSKGRGMPIWKCDNCHREEIMVEMPDPEIYPECEQL